MYIIKCCGSIKFYRAVFCEQVTLIENRALVCAPKQCPFFGKDRAIISTPIKMTFGVINTQKFQAPRILDIRSADSIGTQVKIVVITKQDAVNMPPLRPTCDLAATTIKNVNAMPTRTTDCHHPISTNIDISNGRSGKCVVIGRIKPGLCAGIGIVFIDSTIFFCSGINTGIKISIPAKLDYIDRRGRSNAGNGPSAPCNFNSGTCIHLVDSGREGIVNIISGRITADISYRNTAGDKRPQQGPVWIVFSYGISTARTNIHIKIVVRLGFRTRRDTKRLEAPLGAPMAK
jgi:hypothetical protein